MHLQPVHHNVVCRECSRGTILGKRYRCLNCPNFDVCSSCIDYTSHDPDHIFALANRPLDNRTENKAIIKTVLYASKTSKETPSSFFSTTTNTTHAPRLEHKQGPLFSAIVKDQQQEKKAASVFTFTPPTFGPKPSTDPVNSMFGGSSNNTSPPSSFSGFGGFNSKPQSFFGNAETTNKALQPCFSFGKQAETFSHSTDIEIDDK